MPPLIKRRLRISPEIDEQPLSLRAFAQPRFGQLLVEYRGRFKLGYREAAKESGVPTSTWCRAEAGRDVTLSRAVKLMLWVLGREAADVGAEAPQ